MCVEKHADTRDRVGTSLSPQSSGKQGQPGGGRSQREQAYYRKSRAFEVGNLRGSCYHSFRQKKQRLSTHQSSMRAGQGIPHEVGAEPYSEWPLRSLLKVEQHKDTPLPFLFLTRSWASTGHFKSCGYQKKGNAKILCFTDDTIRSRKPQGVGNDAKQTRAQ